MSATKSDTAFIDLAWAAPADLHPNLWNPNAMDPEMYEKAIASIESFGFVDPITCRATDRGLEIIDGEHRWRAAIEMHLEQVPVIDLGELDDDVARQLTIVLNETRGQSNPEKLGALLRDLASRSSVDSLLATLPYSHDAFVRLTGLPTLDFSELGRNPIRSSDERPAAWVERIYRMPISSAEVIDRALARFRDADEGDGRTPDWKILELLAADYLSGV